MSCRRQVLVKLARIAAVRPPREFPANKEFFRLWKAFHKRNYVQLRIMHSMVWRSETTDFFPGRSQSAALSN
jgi:hypothetical protein